MFYISYGTSRNCSVALRGAPNRYENNEIYTLELGRQENVYKVQIEIQHTVYAAIDSINIVIDAELL